MDAANPLRRWLDRVAPLSLVAGLAAGCASSSQKQSVAAEPPASIRGQAPLAPLPPTAPVMGLPVAPQAPPKVDPQTTPVSLTSRDKSDQPMREFILNDKPRVKVVAVVGKGNIITDEEVWQAVRQRKDFRDAQLTADKEQREAEMYRYHLKRIIERELLIDDMFFKMKKAKPGIMDEIRDYAGKAADKSMREYRRSLGLATEQELQDKALTPQGLTVNVLRRQIERDTICNEYIRSLVKEKQKGIGLGDIHDFYKKYPEKFETKERVKWLDIFIATAKFATPEECRAHAEAVRQQAASGVDFLALVKKYDHGTGEFTRGEGTGQHRGEVKPEELEPTIFAMKQGEVSAVIPVDTGYHILKIAERENAGMKPFDEKTQTAIRGMLFEQMQKFEYTRLVDGLWRTGAVQIIDVP
jgi:hypothetical protein